LPLGRASELCAAAHGRHPSEVASPQNAPGKNRQINDPDDDDDNVAVGEADRRSSRGSDGGSGSGQMREWEWVRNRSGSKGWWW
jgi:hypothetical protein